MELSKRQVIRNVTVLHIIKFFSSLYFYHQILSLLFQSRGLNYTQINSLWGIIVGSQALAEIPSGLIGDKVGRKRSIIIALALQFLGEFFFIFAQTYVAFVLIAVIAGIGFAFLSGCFEAMMYDSLKAVGRENDMQKVAGINGAFALAATMIGSTIGGIITSSLSVSSYINAIIPTACFVFLSFLISFFLLEPTIPYKREDRKAYAILKQGLRTIQSNKSFQRLILLSLLATPFLNYLLNFIPPYFVNADVKGYLFGITLAAASLFGAILSQYAYVLEKYVGVRKGMLIATLTPGILYFFLAGVSHPVFSVILVIFAFGTMHIQKPIFSDYFNRHISSKHRATVQSMINVLSGLYVAFMGLIIGWIGDKAIPYAFMTMGFIICVSALFLRINERHVERNPLD